MLNNNMIKIHIDSIFIRAINIPIISSLTVVSYPYEKSIRVILMRCLSATCISHGESAEPHFVSSVIPLAMYPSAP